MKKHVWKRLVSLLLVLAIGCGFALPAAAADGKPQVSWEQVDNGEVRAALPRNEVTSPEKEPDYQDSDVVRVSIVLESRPRWRWAIPPWELPATGAPCPTAQLWLGARSLR